MTTQATPVPRLMTDAVEFVLVHRTGTKMPTGPEAYRVPKEAGPVLNHPIADAWDELGPQVRSYLDSVNVKWTSIDLVRFTDAEDVPPSPPVLWISVKPGSLSCEDAKVAAVGCEGLLKKIVLADDVTGIEIAFRESLFTRLASAGGSGFAQLLKYLSSFNATVDTRGPLTPALGLKIAARDTPDVEGTGGLYIRDGARIFVLTARHVVLPRDAGPNDMYNRDSADPTQPRRDVLHFCSNAFQGAESQRVLGHIAYSPPISVGAGPETYTEDWALVEIDNDKIDWNTFRGNLIDLGTKASIADVVAKMSPDHTGATTLNDRRLLPIRGIVKEDELCNPTTLDENGRPCFPVVKYGASTGVTIGLLNSMMSFVREYLPDGTKKTSMKLAVLPYMGGAFAARGDSGSIVVDTTGRIVGLLTDGDGTPGTDSHHISYVTPFHWLWDERIKMRFPNACLYQCESEV